MRNRSKTPLFLMELIIMLLVFAISAAVCLQVFAGAKRISAESQQLDFACMEAQKAAEYWKASYGDLEKTAEHMGAVAEGNSFSVYYEEEWLHLEFSREGARADIVIYAGEEEIFSLECEVVMLCG